MLSSVADVARYFPERTTAEQVEEYFRTACGVELVDALERAVGTAAADDPGDDYEPGMVEADEEARPFGTWLFGTVSRELAEFDAWLARCERLADPGGLRTEVVNGLHTLLYNEAIRTLVVELHAARDAGALVGETSAERFLDFVARVSDGPLRADLRRRYPRLHSRLRALAGARLRHVVRVVDQTVAEAGALAGTFPDVEQDFVVERVDLGLGDAHRGGRTVAVVHLSGGARLVYKPRDCRVDVAFQRVVAALDERMGLGLRVLRIHTTDEAGWSEFVEGAPLAEGGEDEYYRQLGQLTALLHVVDGRDVHFENVICDGRGAVVVDLETLLHPRPKAVDTHGAGSATAAASERLERSVVAIGVLPAVVEAGGAEGSAPYHVGAVGHVPGARSPFRSYVLRNDRRDDMHVAFVVDDVESSPQVPALRESVDEATTTADALMRGFDEVYRWVLAHRDDVRTLLAAAFAKVTVRYIHNPTYFYVQLLRMATHPVFQGAEHDARIVLHRVGLRRPGTDPRITRAEVEDLARGDVPYFTVRADECGLVTGGGEVLTGCFAESPLESTLAKVDSLDEDDLAFQLDLVATAFLSKHGPERDSTGVTFAGHDVARRVRPDDALRTATELGEDLVRRVVRSSSSAYPSTWIGPLVTAGETQLWQPGILGYDFYGGITGVALFLAQLAQVTAREDFARTARDVLEPLASQLDHQDWAATGSPCGALVGLAGTAYAVARAGTALDDPALVAAGVRGARAIADVIPFDEQLDLVGGSTGALAVALRLRSLTDDDHARALCLRTARRAFDRLREKHPFFTGGPGEVYAGFAHGAASMHAYVRLLGLVDGDHDVLAAADHLLAQERAFREPGAVRWWVNSRRERTAHGWCNGSAGILLSRLITLRAGAEPDAAVEDEITTTLTDVIELGLGNDVTSCHGDLGVLDILRLAADVLDDPALGRRVEATFDELCVHELATFRSARRNRFAHVDSLLFGAAGVGHALLRSRAPESVPAFLWFD